MEDRALEKEIRKFYGPRKMKKSVPKSWGHLVNPEVCRRTLPGVKTIHNDTTLTGLYFQIEALLEKC